MKETVRAHVYLVKYHFSEEWTLAISQHDFTDGKEFGTVTSGTTYLRIETFDHQVELPPRETLVNIEVDALRDEITRTREVAARQVAMIEERIGSLLALGHEGGDDD